MHYRRLGKTNLQVSVIGIGTWQLGGEWGRDYTQAEADAIFDAARDCRINLIDTAECYGDHTSETLVGAAIQRDREKWVVATKFGHKYTGPMQRSEPRSPADVLRQLEDSLRALRTDYIDILQYHSWGDEQFYDDDVLAALVKAKQQGKFRHLGNSVKGGGAPGQVRHSTQRGIEVIQIVYNRLNRQAEVDSFPACIEQDLGVLARVPLASGWLSGKYRPGAQFPKSDTRSRQKPMTEDDPRWRELQAAIAEAAGTPLAQWALAWCLRHPAVTAVIPGCKNPQQVRDNAAAATLLRDAGSP